MGNVQISPNLKKTSVRIDPMGNIINPETKEIIKPIEPEFVPPKQESTQESILQGSIQESIQESINRSPNKISSRIDEMINKKIEEMVAKKIDDALKNL